MDRTLFFTCEEESFSVKIRREASADSIRKKILTYIHAATASAAPLDAVHIAPTGLAIKIPLREIVWTPLDERFQSNTPEHPAVITIEQPLHPSKEFRGTLGQRMRDLSERYRKGNSSDLRRFAGDNRARLDNGHALGRRTYFLAAYGIVNWEFLERFRTLEGDAAVASGRDSQETFSVIDPDVTAFFDQIPMEQLGHLYDSSVESANLLADYSEFPLASKAIRDCKFSQLVAHLAKSGAADHQVGSREDLSASGISSAADPDSPAVDLFELDPTGVGSTTSFGTMPSNALADSDDSACGAEALEMLEVNDIQNLPMDYVKFNCLTPTSQNDREVFDRIVEAMVRFEYDANSNKGEAQFVSLLWCPILQAAIINRAPGHLAASVEFPVRSMDPNLEEQFVDFVALPFKFYTDEDERTQRRRPPTFFAEASKYRLADHFDEQNGFHHKDYRKLIKMMMASMRHYWGVFRETPEVRKKLRIYGAFLAGSQIQYCVMAPVMHNLDEQPAFIVQTHSHWRVDLFAQSDTICQCIDKRSDESCPFRICISKNVKTLQYTMNAEQIQSVNFDSNVDNYDSDDSDPEAIQQAPASTDGHGQSFEKISKNIFSLIAFGRIVARNQKNLDDALTLLPNPGRPDFIPPKLASMSTKHTSTSPEGRNASTPVENGRKRKRGPIEDESPTRKTNFHLRPAEKGALTVAVIEKWHNPCVEREIQLLFKLQCCRNVVQLLNYESLHAASSWRLVEERLVEFPENWKHFRAEQGMPAACQYLLDGVMALSALTQNRIIHRDVSSGNFLWSPQDRCFKLLDFDSAVQIDPETVKIEYPQRPVCSDGGEMQYQPVGTGRYIAPELFKGAAYSWRTDLFSLGISFCRGWLEQVVQYNSLWPDYDLEKENRKVYKLLRQTVCGLIIEKDPTKRASSLPGLMGKLLEIYRKINSYYRRKPDYYRTVYDNIVESIPADQPLDDWMLSPDNLNDVNMMNGHEVTATG